jgi:hypothetical protein
MVRARIGELDGNLPVANLSSMENLVQTSITQPRLIMKLVSVFAAFALLLARSAFMASWRIQFPPAPRKWLFVCRSGPVTTT